MTLDGLGSAGVAWLIAALLLGLAELAIPGVFLVFLAMAAAVTGGIVLAVPGVPALVQLLAFALWSGVTVLVGRRWYQRYPVDTQDALLNDRAGRLIGRIVTVEAAIIGGNGRVRIGDGAWPARGPDLPAGALARVVVVEDGVVEVIATPAPPISGDPTA